MDATVHPLPESYCLRSLCLHPIGEDQRALIEGIRCDPLNQLRRDVYADWLIEHGEDAEAERQRNWIASCRHLFEFTREFDDGMYDYLRDKYGDDLYYDMVDSDEGRKEALDHLFAGNNWGFLGGSVDHWAESVRDGEGLYFGADWGADQLRGQPEAKAEFLKHVDIVSCQPTDRRWHDIEELPVRCGC